MSAVTAEKPKTGGWLGTVERIGNKVPHPVLMFLYLIIGVIVLSAVMDALGGIGHELGKFIERARCLTHRTHLQPMTEQHDVDQRDQFPEEAFTQVDELCSDAINESDGDRQ